MVNGKCKTLREGKTKIFFEIVKPFWFFNCKTKTSKCLARELKTFMFLDVQMLFYKEEKHKQANKSSTLVKNRGCETPIKLLPEKETFVRPMVSEGPFATPKGYRTLADFLSQSCRFFCWV